MRLVTIEIERRREQALRRTGWIFPQGPATDAGCTESSRARLASHDHARQRLDKLDEQIRAQQDQIAALLHERNARPDNEDIRVRLQQAFEQARLMQQERAERMSVYFHSPFAVPSEEDSNTVREALKILDHYESTSPNDFPSDDAFHSNP